MHYYCDFVGSDYLRIRICRRVTICRVGLYADFYKITVLGLFFLSRLNWSASMRDWLIFGDILYSYPETVLSLFVLVQ